jgi:sterol desaturase/sphingolipid hydroxylase (fatty acid hydroxylase superfamily)
MADREISENKNPIRLFQSDLLEFFTHVHPAVVLCIWVPVVAGFLAWSALQKTPGAELAIPVCALIGLFSWSLVEYVLHRFIFHFQPRTPRQERLSFLFHGVHHAQPLVKTRLVMPPAVSVPLALFFYALSWLVGGKLLGHPVWGASFFAGLVSGYVGYDMLHYAMHHFRLKSRPLAFLRRHHMQHHAVSWDRRFGVSSPLWDHVFGTEPDPRTPPQGNSSPRTAPPARH